MADGLLHCGANGMIDAAVRLETASPGQIDGTRTMRWRETVKQKGETFRSSFKHSGLEMRWVWVGR